MLASPPVDTTTAAIVGPGVAPMSCGGFRRQVAAVGGDLFDRDVRTTDRVAAIVPDPRQLALVFLGIAGRAVSAPLDPALTPEEDRRGLVPRAPTAMVVGTRIDPETVRRGATACSDSGGTSTSVTQSNPFHD